MTVVRELVTLLGFDVQDANIKKAERSYQKLKTLAFGVSAAFAAVGTAVAAALIKTAKEGDAAANSAKALGIGVEALQELEHAASLSGSSAEGLRAALVGLSKASTNLNKSKKLGAILGELGIRSKDARGRAKALDEILLDVADRFEKMPDGARKTALAMRLFGGEGSRLVPMLSQGRKEIERLRQEARDLGIVFSPEEAKQAKEFADGLELVKKIGTGALRQFAMPLLPVVTKLMEAFKEWAIVNKDWIRTQGGRAAKLVAFGIKALVAAVRAGIDFVSGWVKTLGGLKNVLWLLAGVLALVSLARIGGFVKAITLLMAPIKTITGLLRALSMTMLRNLIVPALMGAAFVGLALIIEDAIATLQGKDTIIRRIMDRLKEPIDPKDNAILNALKEAYGWVDELTRRVSLLVSLFGGDAIGEQEEAAHAVRKTAMGDAASLVLGDGGFIKKSIRAATIPIDPAGLVFGGWMRDWLSFATREPRTAGAGGTTNIVNVDARGATSPAEVETAAERIFKRALRGGQLLLDGGVAR